MFFLWFLYLVLQTILFCKPFFIIDSAHKLVEISVLSPIIPSQIVFNWTVLAHFSVTSWLSGRTFKLWVTYLHEMRFHLDFNFLSWQIECRHSCFCTTCLLYRFYVLQVFEFTWGTWLQCLFVLCCILSSLVCMKQRKGCHANMCLPQWPAGLLCGSVLTSCVCNFCFHDAVLALKF